MGETVAFTYRAFISYSHADTSWAKWLHRGLESFRIDKDLAGRETETGPVPASLRPVFRDRDDFTAGALRSVRAGHAVRDHMSRAHPDNVAYRYAVAESHADAATVLTRQGEGVEALAELRKAKAIVEALLANAPDDAKFRTGLKTLNDEISKLDKAETAGP